jgi:hypothetical protein
MRNVIFSESYKRMMKTINLDPSTHISKNQIRSQLEQANIRFWNKNTAKKLNTLLKYSE